MVSVNPAILAGMAAGANPVATMANQFKVVEIGESVEMGRRRRRRRRRYGRRR